MRIIGWRASAAGLLAGLGTATCAFASPIEREIDTTGQLGAVTLSYGDHTINAALATAQESDNYSFAGQAGDRIRILVRTGTPGLDAALTLRGPNSGTVLKTAGCDGLFNQFSIFCSATLDQTLPGSGQYTINLADLQVDEAGSYQLHLERYPPVNNWVGVRYGAPGTTETLGHTTDMDFFGFNGVAGTGVRFALASKQAGLDPSFEIWDPTGAKVGGGYCEGLFNQFSVICSTSSDLDLSVSGVYKIGLSDIGNDEKGGYQFALSCLYGNCPLPTALPPSPFPVPEPATYLLMLLGVGVLAARTARDMRSASAIGSGR